MLRPLIAAFAVVAVGSRSAPAGRAAEKLNQDPSVTEKTESAVDKRAPDENWKNTTGLILRSG